MSGRSIWLYAAMYVEVVENSNVNHSRSDLARDRNLMTSGTYLRGMEGEGDS